MMRILQTKYFRHCALWAIFLSAFCCAVEPGWAQVSKEYQVKAVALWRLAQFVEWPTNAYDDAGSPIVIGVVGENPFGDALEVAVRGETAHRRKLVVQRYRRVEELKPCHVLFISRSEIGRVNKVIEALASQSVLTVSDIEGFARFSGGMVGLTTEQNKIKLRVNVEAAKAAHLVLDARLLRMAEVVQNP